MRLRGLVCEMFVLAGVLLAAISLSKSSAAINFDGLFVHVEFVKALMSGWNPILDPKFTSPELVEGINHIGVFQSKLASGGFYLKYGQIVSAVFGSAFGLEAGKTVNFLYLYFLFRSLPFLLKALNLSDIRIWVLTILICLNPVILYQLPSFWHDGLVACLLSVMLIAGVSFLKVQSLLSFCIYIFASALLIGTKKSGLGYSVIFFGLFLMVFLGNIIMSDRKREFGILSVVSGSLILLFVVLLKSGLWDLGSNIPLLSDIGDFSSLVGKAGDHVFEQFPEYASMSGLEQYIYTSFSESSVVPVHPHLKIPGTITANEIHLFLHSFTGYWIGGFGPLYGLAMLLGSFTFLISLFRSSMGNRNLLTAFFCIIISVVLVPSLFARWIPHAWIFPFLFLLKPEANTRIANKKKNLLFSLADARSVQQLSGSLAVAVCCLNVLFVFSLTLVGHIHIKQILGTQLDLLKQLNVPLQVQFDWFPSNRFWFENRTIDYEMVNADHVGSFTHLYRTNTRVFITPNELEQQIIYRGEPEKMTLNDAFNKLESELWSGEYDIHWIKPIVVQSSNDS